MGKCYFELRKQSKIGSINLPVDVMRHLHTRQYLGKAIIICDRPSIFLSTAHKQWLKISRSIQSQRTSTLNADKILKYTHTITHMQHLKFVAKTPLQEPDADVYFLKPDQLDTIPLQSLTIYLITTVNTEQITTLHHQVPADALFVDYAQNIDWHTLQFQPKKALEEKLTEEWIQVQAFLTKRHIDLPALFSGPLHNIEAMDNALDTLLEVGHAFLQVANAFNHALELARPLHISKAMRQQYDTFTLLAHRVQALSTVGFTQRFLETYNEDDTFFLYDSRKFSLQHFSAAGESLLQAITRHKNAGRIHLAKAIEHAAQATSTNLKTNHRLFPSGF